MYRETNSNNVFLLIKCLKLGRKVALIAIKDNYPVDSLPVRASIFIKVCLIEIIEVIIKDTILSTHVCY